MAPDFASIADLIERVSADDAARAASRDLPAPVTGALLRRAVEELGQAKPPLAPQRLTALRNDGLNAARAGWKATPDFDGDDFTVSSETGSVTVRPPPRAERYIAVAVAASQPDVDEMLLGGFDQASAFAGPFDVVIGGVAHRYWRTAFAWALRGPTEITLRPFTPGSRKWGDPELDALPAALARIQAALDDASADIDGRLRGRYSAGLEIAGALRAKAIDLAAFALLGGAEDSPEAMRYRVAVRWLRDVSDGKIDLPAPPSGDAPMARRGCVTFDPKALQRDYVQAQVG